MSRANAPAALRLLALALAIVLLWLAQQAGREGIAGIFSASAADDWLEMSKTTAQSDKWAHSLAEGERNIALALELAPRHPDYALQAADFAFERQQVEAATLLLRTVLPDVPGRADIWSRLARANYVLDGPSLATLQALDQALYFGPREDDTLLLNATITLSAGAELDVERQLSGWNTIVEAAGMPGLSTRITALVTSSGMERQLQMLLRQKVQQQGAREQRGQEPGDGG